MFSFDEIKNADIEIAEAMQDEMDRQHDSAKDFLLGYEIL